MAPQKPKWSFTINDYFSFIVTGEKDMKTQVLGKVNRDIMKICITGDEIKGILRRMKTDEFLIRYIHGHCWKMEK